MGKIKKNNIVAFPNNLSECVQKIRATTERRCLNGDGHFFYGTQGSFRGRCDCCTTYDAPINTKSAKGVTLYKLA